MIGVFDSGVGGLTVAKAIIERLPSVDLLYFGDTARTPYGTRTVEEVIEFAEQDARFLIDKGADVVVIGCHTAAAVATEHLRATFPKVSIVSVLEFGIEDAIHETQTGHIAVFGTDRTAKTRAHEILLKRLNPYCRVTTVGLSSLVPLVESGDSHAPEIHDVIQNALKSLSSPDFDTAILACTHFPIILDAFKECLGSGVRIIDPADDLASTLHEPASFGGTSKPVHTFCFSSPIQATTMAEKLLGDRFSATIVPQLG